MSIAFINPAILAWARERASLSFSDLLAFHQKYDLWEKGKEKPTFKQAQNLAKKFHIPFGYLYLSEPPVEEKLTADLRTIEHAGTDDFSPDLREVIEDAVRKQDWLRDFLKEDDEDPLPFVGKFSLSIPAQSIAADMIQTLDLSVAHRHGMTQNNFLRDLTERAEEAGVLVLRSGKVGNNTHRKLNIEEFRGFALPDDLAPVIFINGADFPAGQIFTFVHELAHIWLGNSGVSNAGMSMRGKYPAIEVLCNKVAAEVLVPEEDFKREWHRQTGDNLERFSQLVRVFKVSSVVIARRALDLNEISAEEFSDYYRKSRDLWKVKKQASSGGSFHDSFRIANGQPLVQAICHSVYSGDMLMRDGARLLGVKPSTLDKYVKHEGMF